MRVRIFKVLSTAALGLICAAQAREARADVIFSNFGPSQTYEGNSWWIVGNVSNNQAEVDAFPIYPDDDGDIDRCGPGIGGFKWVKWVGRNTRLPVDCVHRVGFRGDAGNDLGYADAGGELLHLSNDNSGELRMQWDLLDT